MQRSSLLAKDQYVSVPGELGKSKPAFEPESDSKVPADQTTITIRSTPVVLSLAFLTAALLTANCAVIFADHFTGYEPRIVSKLVKVFSFDQELNFPSYFSMLILLIASTLFAVITVIKRRVRDSNFIFWAVLAGGFLFMSFDEIVSAHEKMIEPMQNLMGGENLGVFYFGWVVPGIILVAILGVFFVRFWWNLPSKTRLLTAIAAVVYLGGALGMELVGGRYAELYGKDGFIYQVLTTIEELMEMIGTIILIKALIDYIVEHFEKPRIEFSR